MKIDSGFRSRYYIVGYAGENRCTVKYVGTPGKENEIVLSFFNADDNDLVIVDDNPVVPVEEQLYELYKVLKGHPNRCCQFGIDVYGAFGKLRKKELADFWESLYHQYGDYDIEDEDGL